MPIKAGSYLTFSVQGHAGVQSPDDLARQVSAYLRGSGLVDVSDNRVQPTRDLLSDILQGNVLSWDYIAATTVRTLYDEDAVTDEIQPLITQAFADVTSYDPTGVFLQNTNTRVAPTPPAPTPGLLDNIASVGASLNDDAKIAIYGVLGLAVVVLLLIAFGPNVPKLVPVLRL